MTEFFKSAMGYLNSSPGCENDCNFVGQNVEINSIKLRVKRIIAEGGFAFVYVVQDIDGGNEYALKRLIGADKEACNNIISEINIHKQLSGDPNIVKFLGATFIDKTQGQQAKAEYLLLMELCKGSLIDCIGQAGLEPALVLRIFYQACKAVGRLHSQQTSIIHRDIKVENFLLGSDGLLKLCDFGSATTEIFEPNSDWGAQRRNALEDHLATVTTPMYRAPELLDTWTNYPIGPKSDVWALGCVLFYLCFQKHPFEDSAKLRIINGNYTIPSDSRYNCFHDIIKGCLTVDPVNRLSISIILEKLAAISETKGWSLKAPINLVSKSATRTPPPEMATPEPSPAHIRNSNADLATIPQRPTRPAPPRPAASNVPPIDNFQRQNIAQTNNHIPINNTQQAIPSTGLFSSLRGGAGSFLKNLKDTSSKVMQTVQQSIARTDIDISYITSRILVMPCPSEGLESAYKTNNIEDVKLFVESRYSPTKISVYNLGPRTCPRLPPPIRTVEVNHIYNCVASKAPNLNGMFSLAEDMFGFLSADQKSIVIIQSPDNGHALAATMVSALLMYASLVTEPEDAVQIFAVKRNPPNIRASELRYLYYLGDILRSTPHLPHYKPLTLVSICCQPIPRMTKARDGCRLFMEIYCNDRLLLNTIQEYDKMRLYSATESKVNLPINLTVSGDLVIILYHARNALKGMGRPHGIKICQFQLNTGFIPEQETLINFTKNDLDELPEPGLIAQNFSVSLSMMVNETECLPSKNPPWIPAKSKRNPINLFSSQLEYEEMVDNFVSKTVSKSIEKPTRPKPPPPRPAVPLEMDTASTIIPDVAAETRTEFPNPTIDLLNLQSESQKPKAPQKAPSFDLLGSFDAPESHAAPIPDLLGNTQPTTAGLDDIFGSFVGPKENVQPSAIPDLNIDFNAFTTSTNTKQPDIQPQPLNPQGTSFNSATNKEPQVTKPKDPFADIANLASGFNLNFASNFFGSKTVTTTTTTTTNTNTTTTAGSTRPTDFSSPAHHSNNNNNNNNNNNINNNSGISNTPSPAHNNQKSPASGSQQMGNQTPPQQQQNMNASASPRLDNIRAHFESNNSTPKQQQKGGIPGGDIFADILGEQGYKFGNKINQGPRSINEMRKEELVKDMDPDKLRIMEWTDGKKNNIRALLCSMHTVLWTDAKWTKCDMHQLVSVSDVKKSYRRACLAVHPDKNAGTDNEEVAKLIFMELNNAWSDFENDATQQNIFSS